MVSKQGTPDTMVCVNVVEGSGKEQITSCADADYITWDNRTGDRRCKRRKMKGHAEVLVECKGMP